MVGKLDTIHNTCIIERRNIPTWKAKHINDKPRNGCVGRSFDIGKRMQQYPNPCKMPYIKYMHIGNFWLECRIPVIFYPFVPGKEDILSNRRTKIHAIISKIENFLGRMYFLLIFSLLPTFSMHHSCKHLFSIKYYVLHHYSLFIHLGLPEQLTYYYINIH